MSSILPRILGQRLEQTHGGLQTSLSSLKKEKEKKKKRETV